MAAAQDSLPARSLGLAGLRGIAASLVVFYHALLVFEVGEHEAPHQTSFDLGAPWQTAMQVLIALFNGPNAVILFFVLSGTVLTMSLDRRPFGRAALANYYIRRTFRIMPLLAVASGTAAAAHILLFSDIEVRSGTEWMNGYYRHDPGAAEVALNALGFSNSLNSPAWTIRVEIVASVLFPLLYLLRAGIVVIGATLAGLTLIALVDLKGMVHVFLISFYLGALAPTWGCRIVKAMRLSGRSAGLLMIGLVVFAALVDRGVRPSEQVEPVRVLLISPAAALLVTLALCGYARRPLEHRAFLFLGEISYSLYLLHFGIIFAIARGVAPFLPQVMQEGQAVVANVGLGLAAFLIAVPLSSLVYRIVELPFQNLGRDIAASWTRRPPLSIQTGSGRG